MEEEIKSLNNELKLLRDEMDTLKQQVVMLTHEIRKLEGDFHLALTSVRAAP